MSDQVSGNLEGLGSVSSVRAVSLEDVDVVAVPVEGQLVGKSAMLPKHGDDVPLERSRELSGGIRLQVHRDVACEHNWTP